MIFSVPEASFSIVNKDNQLVLMENESAEISDGWAGKNLNKLDFSSYLNEQSQNIGIQQGEEQKKYILAPNIPSQLSPDVLLKHNIDWVILKKEIPENMQTMFIALQVNWLVVSTDEMLVFYFHNGQRSLRHSSCIFSFFLFKSDTCRRVEKLESVLNYIQT
jgi:competence protein ComEC